MSEQRVIQTFCWDPGSGFDPRADSLISDDTKIRIDPGDWKLKLKLNSLFRYPTDSDLNIRSYTVSLKYVDELEMLQLIHETPTGTSIGIRLFDGTDEWWWNGAVWASSPAVGEWNTAAEINTNISTYDVSTTRTLGVVVNLVTTDDKITPTVSAVKVLWKGSFLWLEDLMIDSLVGMFQDELKFDFNLGLPPLPSASASIDLNDYSDDASGDLEYSDAIAVYDHDADPNKKVNLLDSYNSGTKVLTLTSAIPLGNRPLLRMQAKVNCAWDTHRDFEPIGKLPQLILRNSESISSAPYPSAFGDGIVREDTGVAVEIPPPYRMTFQVTAEIRTDRNSREQMSLIENMMKLFSTGPDSESGPFMRQKATDSRIRMLLMDEYRSRDIDLSDGDVASHTMEFLIQNAPIQLKPAEDTFAVSALKLKYANVGSVQRQQALSDGAPVPHTPFEEIETN